MSDDDGLVKIVIKDIVVECAQTSGEILPDNIRFTIVETETDLGLKKILKTQWRCDGNLNVSLSMKSSSIIIKSEDGIELGNATLTNQDWMAAAVHTTSGRDLKRRLEGGNDGLDLTISIRFDIWNSSTGTEENRTQESSSALQPHLTKASATKSWRDRLFKNLNLKERIVTAYNKERSMSLNTDAVDHFQRFKATGALEDLDKAIAKWQSAGEVAVPEDLPMFKGLLGQSFRHRFETTDDVADLAESISYALEAVKLTPEGDPDITIALFSLGASYYSLFQKCGALSDLVDAIHYEERAVGLLPEGNPRLPDMVQRLGVLCYTLFSKTGDRTALANAVKYGQQSVKLTPDGHPNLPGRLAKLGLSFEKSGDVFKAVEVRQRSVALTSKGDPDLPGRLTNLGVSYHSCFRKGGNTADLKLAIDSLYQAVELTPEGHPELSIIRTNLGAFLCTSFEALRNLADLTEAIYNQEEGVRLTSKEDPKLAVRLGQLAISCFHHFEQTGNLSDLEKAIDNGKLSVKLTPEGHYDLPARLINLATAYNTRFAKGQKLTEMEVALSDVQHTGYIFEDDELPLKLNDFANSFYSHFADRGDLTDLDEAIKYYQQALKLMPKDHPDLPNRFSMVAVSFQERFIKCRNLGDLDKAIHSYQQSVDCTPPEDLHMPSRLHHLAMSLDMRFQVSGDLTDLVKVISTRENSVKLTSKKDPLLSTRLFTLANSFYSCFDRTGDRSHLISAIQKFQEAANVASEEDPNLPLCLSQLGSCLLRNFQYSENSAELTEAIHHTKQAIKLLPQVKLKDQWLPLQFGQLACLFSNKFELTGDFSDLKEAIQNQRQAVDVPETHPDLPYWLANLANFLGTYFDKSGDLASLIEAIERQKRAVKITPEGDVHLTEWLKVIGELLKTHFQATGDQDSLASAIQHFCLSATSTTGPTIIRLGAAKLWAELSRLIPFKLSASESLKPYECIINLLSLLTGFNRTVQYRHNLLADYSQLPLAAAAVAISVGQLCKAVEWLEQGRCVVWNQLNQLRTPLDVLESYNPALAKQLSQLSTAIENAGSADAEKKKKKKTLVDARIAWENEAQNRRNLAKEREELLASIRELPGLEGFLQPRKYADLTRNLPSNGVVIIINVYTSQCDALALQANIEEPMHIQLPKFSFIQAISLVKDLDSYLADRNILIRAMVPSTSRQQIGNNLTTLLKKAWINIIKPIIDALGFLPNPEKDLPHIWWCPTGPLSFFPIHAAGIYTKGKASPGQCVSDFAISSYIPNLTALLEKLTHKPTGNNNNMGLMIVSQPSTPGQSSLPSVRKEVQKVKEQLSVVKGIPVSIFDNKDGTVDLVSKDLESFTCIHLACHASQDMRNPLKSAFHLYDGPLELATVMQKKLPHADLAFLSACQTSTGDQRLSEEAVHLAGGMLAAGYRSIVATMWSILDIHGPFVAERFYKSLLECVEGKGERKLNGGYAAYALHSAIQQLKQQPEIYRMDDPLLAWVPYIHVGI